MDPSTNPPRSTDLDHDQWWHEDDCLHQAEGVLSVQLAVSLGESSALLRAHSEATGTALDTIAAQVVGHELFITGLGRGPEPPRSN